MRYVLLGDGESPHLLKWARALAARPGLDLWVVSSRGFLPGFDGVVPPDRRLALATRPVHGGGNVALLRTLPRLTAWLRRVDADWLNPHYLTSHGTLAWLARRLGGLRGQLVGSAWGSDILVTPDRSAAYRALTRRVLAACTVCTSDSQHMAERMRDLGAREVVTFPFGLASLPPPPPPKAPWAFFANRGLAPVYRPDRVLDAFARVHAARPDARLVVANDGPLRADLEARVATGPLAPAVRFVGRLEAAAQDRCYAEAQWYLSLPASDSVSVSVLEAMAHGCLPVLSDLPANRELVRHGDNGLVVADVPDPDDMARLLARGDTIAADNRAWVARHALFAPAVDRFLDRLAMRSPA